MLDHTVDVSMSIKPIVCSAITFFN